MIDETQGFTLVREYDATIDQLWQAWTDPDSAAEWLHPAGAHTPRASVAIDARVGGGFTYTMVNDTNGEEYPTGGEYLEVVPKERLRFSWGTPGELDEAPVISLTFESLGELSRLTLDLRGSEGMKGDGFIYDGWESALDELAQFVGQTPVAG